MAGRSTDFEKACLLKVASRLQVRLQVVKQLLPDFICFQEQADFTLLADGGHNLSPAKIQRMMRTCAASNCQKQHIKRECHHYSSPWVRLV